MPPPRSALATLRVKLASPRMPPPSPLGLTDAEMRAAAVAMRDVKDAAGRTTLALTLEAAPAAAAEALATMTLSLGGAATTAFSSRVIASGKRLRISAAVLHVEALGSGTAPQRAYLRMRSNGAGATVAASPLQWLLPVAVSPAAVNAGAQAALPLPDGFELAGDGTRTFGFTLECPDYVAVTATLRVKATILALEY